MAAPDSPGLTLESIAELLRDLVRIKTANPPGEEKQVALIVADRLKRSGFSVELHECEAGRPSVVGRFQGTGKGVRLLFNGHMDTMPPGSGWTRDPFAGDITDGRLYGCGAFDMKAGLAAMILAACAYARNGAAFDGELIVTAVPDEIAGGAKGTGHLVKNGLVAADLAVVCEPTGEQVFLAHRGALWLEIAVQGKSAHGGRPWLGVNAISKMVAITRALESELPARLATKTHPLVPSPTLNIGTIHGGDRVNMVPDRCVLQIDRRLIPGENVDAAEAEVREIVERVMSEDCENWSVMVTRFGCVDPAEVAPQEPIVQECQRAYREVTGRPCGLSATAGFEDAHYFIHAGIPTAMFGPFVPGTPDTSFVSLAGAPDEYVEISKVLDAAKTYYRLCENLLPARVTVGAAV